MEAKVQSQERAWLGQRQKINAAGDVYAIESGFYLYLKKEFYLFIYSFIVSLLTYFFF